MAQASKTPLEVHFFSDMQKSSMPPAFADLRLADDTDMTFHSVARTEGAELAGRKRDRSRADLTTQESARASGDRGHRHRSRHPHRFRWCWITRSSRPRQVNVPANGRVTVEFLTLESPYGFHRAEIRIEPHDALREDDRFPFAVERADPHRVLFLHEAGQNRGELYYRTALEAAPNAGFVMEPLGRESGRQSVASKYAFVVLSDVGIAAFRFGGLAQEICDGRRVAVYRAGPVFGARCAMCRCWTPWIQDTRSAAREGERFQSVASADPQHPAMRRTQQAGWSRILPGDQGRAGQGAGDRAAHRPNSAAARAADRRRPGAGVRVHLRQHLQRFPAALFVSAVY